MNPSSQSPALLRLERRALAIGIAALLASVLLGWIAPPAIGAAYRLAIFACVAPALGSIVFQLIHQMTGGQWATALHPFLVAGTNLLPWTWLFALPLLFFPGEHGFAHPEIHDTYASQPMIVLRAVVYGLVFWLLVLGLRRVRRARLAGDHVALRWVAPAGLIGLVFVLHLLAEDWLAALDPGWHSTAFPIVWVTGQALAGLALAIFCAVLGGAQPNAAGSAARPLGLDWGNLLLAATMFFAYVAFAQFLIIWAGNLPREISWYRARAGGGWTWVVAALAIFHFGLPFLFLLSRRFKRFPAGLAGVSAMLLAAQLTYLAWIILPAFQPLRPLSCVLAVTLPAAALALFLNRYLAAARRLQEIAA